MIVQDLLKDYSRFDKRELLDSRTSEISKMENFYFINHGQTQIIALYHISEVKPYIDKPNEGILNINCLYNNKRHDRLNNFLYKIYLNQKCIDLESMCINFNKKVISLYIELRILNLDGNCFEPSVNIINHLLKDLNINYNYLPTCYYFIAINNLFLRDPIEDEDLEKEWYYLIATKSKNEFIYIEKIGKENEIDDIYQILEITQKSNK